jgi:hypothetical protein
MWQHSGMTLFELIVARSVQHHGMIKGGSVGGRLAAFVIEWDRYVRETGESPGTAYGYSKWGYMPQRSAYNRMTSFTTVFPEFETPTELLALVPATEDVRQFSGLALA